MRKLAIFVEGNTELVFATALIECIAGPKSVLVEQRRIRGGSSARRSMAQIQAVKPNTGQRYYVLIVDCGGDDLVKTRIREEHDGLTRASYTQIIGMRDVRPQFARHEIARLEAGLPKYIKTKLTPVQFVLQVMEIEAWFLAEFSHFSRIDPAITPAAIHAALGFHPETDDMALRNCPADDLNACYAIGGKTYSKGTSPATVAALDPAYMYLELPNKIPYLRALVDSIDAFLS